MTVAGVATRRSWFEEAVHCRALPGLFCRAMSVRASVVLVNGRDPVDLASCGRGGQGTCPTAGMQSVKPILAGEDGLFEEGEDVALPCRVSNDSATTTMPEPAPASDGAWTSIRPGDCLFSCRSGDVVKLSLDDPCAGLCCDDMRVRVCHSLTSNYNDNGWVLRVCPTTNEWEADIWAGGIEPYSYCSGGRVGVIQDRALVVSATWRTGVSVWTFNGELVARRDLNFATPSRLPSALIWLLTASALVR